MKHILTGSIDGETIDLNEKTGILRIGLKRDRALNYKTRNAALGKEGPTVVIEITGESDFFSSYRSNLFKVDKSQ